jgi:hypothetical protein
MTSTERERKNQHISASSSSKEHAAMGQWCNCHPYSSEMAYHETSKEYPNRRGDTKTYCVSRPCSATHLYSPDAWFASIVVHENGEKHALECQGFYSFPRLLAARGLSRSPGHRNQKTPWHSQMYSPYYRAILTFLMSFQTLPS